MNERFRFVLALLSCVASLVTLGAMIALYLQRGADPPTHNAAGGYIEACGDLPGMVGDDC